MNENLLPSWVSQDQWFEQSGKSLFLSRARWDWFFRTHKRELIEEDVIGILGRHFLVDSSRIARVLERLIREDARRRVTPPNVSPANLQGI